LPPYPVSRVLAQAARVTELSFTSNSLWPAHKATTLRRIDARDREIPETTMNPAKIATILLGCAAATGLAA
jgi:hypothetical protein